MKIIDEPNPEIPAINMEDGEIGIITKWAIPSYEGSIVQRWKDTLVSLGKSSGDSWPNFFLPDHLPSSNNKVRLLKKGTKLEI